MNSQYNFSYSGSDVKALIKSTDSNTAYKVLNTLTTVSFSVNEQKTPVRRLGRRHVVGFTKAIRTIAGTMVLTVLKGHPLTELYTVGDYYKAGEMGQGIHRPNSYHFATNVPPFDLKLIYQTEHNSNYYAELVIKGIEIISQSIVTSVNDMITECVLQFVARDYNEFINHVSDVTEQSHERIKVNMMLDQLQIEEEKKEEVASTLSNVDSLTLEDIRAMGDYIENAFSAVPEKIQSVISKIKETYSQTKKQNDLYLWEAADKFREELRLKYEQQKLSQRLSDERSLDLKKYRSNFNSVTQYQYSNEASAKEDFDKRFNSEARGYMGTVPDLDPPLYVDDVSLENLKQEQIQDWLWYQFENGEISSMLTSFDDTQKLLNGVTETEQNLIEEQGTLESEEERTARYNKNDTNGIP